MKEFNLFGVRRLKSENSISECRSLTIWGPETGEHIEITCYVHEIQKAGFEEGSKLSIKIEKKFDIDTLTHDLLKPQ